MLFSEITDSRPIQARLVVTGRAPDWDEGLQVALYDAWSFIRHAQFPMTTSALLDFLSTQGVERSEIALYGYGEEGSNRYWFADLLVESQTNEVWVGVDVYVENEKHRRFTCFGPPDESGEHRKILKDRRHFKLP